MARAIVLVDGGYFDYINSYSRNVHGSKVDIQAFGEKLADHFGVNLLRLKYYHSLPYSDVNRELTPEEQAENERTQSFFDTVDDLTNCEHVKAGRVQESREHCPECNQTYRDRNQKGTDVQIAVDLAKMAFDQHSPECFILVAGDEDLIHGVRVAKDTHSNVYLGYAYDQSHQLFSAQLLRQECDDKVNIVDDFLESVTL